MSLSQSIKITVARYYPGLDARDIVAQIEPLLTMAAVVPNSALDPRERMKLSGSLFAGSQALIYDMVRALRDNPSCSSAPPRWPSRCRPACPAAALPCR